MVRLRIRPGIPDSPDSHLGSTVQSKCNNTVATSSVASYDESDHSSLLELPSLNKQLRKELKSVKEDASRWKNALNNDIRPGSHYRRKIALLKKELDKRDDVIHDREIIIENLMTGNHHHQSHHPINIQQLDCQQTSSVCSSLLDDLAESPQAREMERLLLENSAYVFQLQGQDEEIAYMRLKISKYERERDGMRENITILSSQQTMNQRELEDCRISSDEKVNKESTKSISVVPFDPFQSCDSPEDLLTPSHIVNQSSSHSGSIRETKRIMELHNELSKTTKDRKNCHHELQLSQREVERLHIDLRDVRLQSETTILELENLKKQNEEESLTAEGEIQDLKKALEESLVELEHCTKVMTEQSKNIQKMRNESSIKEKTVEQLQQFFQKKTESFETVNREIMKKAAEIEELELSRTEYCRKFSNNIENTGMKIDTRDKEIERLHQQRTLLGGKLVILRKHFDDKETKVKELELAIIETGVVFDTERKARIQSETDKAKLLNKIKEDSEKLRKHFDDKEIMVKELELAIIETGATLDTERKARVQSETDKAKLLKKMKEESEKLVTLRKKFDDKETKVEELELAIIETGVVFDTERKARIQSETDKAKLLNKMKEESDILLQKTNCQKIQLQKKERRLLETEIDKDKLETTMKDMYSILEKTKSEYIAIHVKSVKASDCLQRKLQMKMDEIHQNKQINSEQDIMSAEFQAEIEKLKRDLEKSFVDQSNLANDKDKLETTMKDMYSILEKTKSEYIAIHAKSVKDSDCLERKLQMKIDEILQNKQINSEQDKMTAGLQASIEKLKRDLEKSLADQSNLANDNRSISKCFAERIRESNSLRQKLVLQVEAIQLQNEKTQQIQQKLVDKDGKVADLEASNTKLSASLSTASAEQIKLIVGKEKILRLIQQRDFEKLCLTQDLESCNQATHMLHRKISDKDDNIAALVDKNNGLEKDLELKNSELMKLKKVKEQNHSLMTAMVAQTKTIHVERQEKVEVEGHRDNLVTESKSLQHDLKEMGERNQYLQEEITLLTSSFDRLSNEVMENNAKIKELEDDIVVRKDVYANNAELIKKNVYLAGKIDQLSLEIQELNQKLPNQLYNNEVLVSLKGKLEEAKKLETDTTTSYERKIYALAMNKDSTIDTLRKDLAASRHRNADEVARLTNELSEVQNLNTDLWSRCDEDAIRMKDQRIDVLKHTLFAQEKIIDSLRAELGQVQLGMRNVSERRRKDLEELQTELMQSKLNATKHDRACAALNVKLDECKSEYEEEIVHLSREIEKLRKDLPLSRTMKDLQETYWMLEAKERLEHLKVMNIELKEDNIKLSAKLERALIKIHSIKKENANELESLLENNVGKSTPNINSRGKLTGNLRRGKSTGSGETEIPSVLYIDTSETLEEEMDSVSSRESSGIISSY
jgi:chromosome segregation ATPase